MSEVDAGTIVTVRNSSWPADVPKLHKIDNTWKAILDALQDVLEKGDVSTGLRVQYALIRVFLWAMPAGT